jgi:hypothetical protein
LQRFPDHSAGQLRRPPLLDRTMDGLSTFLPLSAMIPADFRCGPQAPAGNLLECCI